MLYPKARPRQSPISKKLVERIEDRTEKLIEDLDSEFERMIVPTPALSEFLIMVGNDGPAYLEKLSSIRNILMRPFDELAAIELAAIEVEDRSKGSKRGGSASPWAKIRFDRQVVAIAKTNRAKRIYSDNNDIINFGTKIGIEVIPTWNLPLPAAKQIDLEL